jgi:hypothetical protein
MMGLMGISTITPYTSSALNFILENCAGGICSALLRVARYWGVTG